MASYYVTQSGTGDGTGADAANTMSVSLFNVISSFAAGDEVLFSGAFSTEIDIRLGGTADNPITYKGTNSSFVDDGTAAMFTVSGSGYAINIEANYVLVENFAVTNNGSGGCFGVSGHIDNASDANDSVHLRDCTAVANNGDGDGFAIIYAQDSTTKATFTRCEAQSITGAGDQGFTNHNNQTSFLIECSSTSACQLPIACVGDSVIITGGVFRNGGDSSDLIFVGGGTTLVATDATFISQGTGSMANIFSTGAGKVNSITLNNCSVSQSVSAAGQNYLQGLPGSGFYMQGGELNINSTASVFMNIVGDGVDVHFDDVDINIQTIGQRAISISSGANASVIVENSTIDYSNAIHSTHTFIADSSTSLNASYQINNNVIHDGNDIGFIETHSNTLNTYSVSGNTFRDFAGSRALFESSYTTDNAGALYVANNQFDNVTDVLFGDANATLANNIYINGTPLEAIETSSPVIVPIPDIAWPIMMLCLYLIVRKHAS